jgi:hypothetical protein
MPKRPRPTKADMELMRDLEGYVSSPLTCNEGEEEEAEALFAELAETLEELNSG